MEEHFAEQGPDREGDEVPAPAVHLVLREKEEEDAHEGDRGDGEDAYEGKEKHLKKKEVNQGDGGEGHNDRDRIP